MSAEKSKHKEAGKGKRTWPSRIRLGAHTRRRMPSAADRWSIYASAAGAALLYLTLEDRVRFGPAWLVPVAMAVLLAPLIAIVPDESGYMSVWRRALGIGLVVVLIIANFLSLGLIIYSLLYQPREGSPVLIIEAGKIWAINVLVFALWYWELDGGGPGKRTREQGSEEYPDFLFPQMSTTSVVPPNWEPTFIDYLYLSFTNSTAFSPTDTLPLKPLPKVLMMVQSLASLLIVALVTARAVNILAVK